MRPRNSRAKSFFLRMPRMKIRPPDLQWKRLDSNVELQDPTPAIPFTFRKLQTAARWIALRPLHRLSSLAV